MSKQICMWGKGSRLGKRDRLNVHASWEENPSTIRPIMYIQKKENENRFLRCICCGGFTLHRLGKWWIHRKCEEELKYRIILAKYALPKIKYELLFGSPKLFEACVLNFGNWNIVKSIRRDISRKAWQIFEERYGKPSWLRGKA